MQIAKLIQSIFFIFFIFFIAFDFFLKLVQSIEHDKLLVNEKIHKYRHMIMFNCIGFYDGWDTYSLSNFR